jgi:hypothetical protein
MKGDTLSPPMGAPTGDPSLPGGGDSEDEAAGLTGSLSTASPLAPTAAEAGSTIEPGVEVGTGAPDIGHEVSAGDDLGTGDIDVTDFSGTEVGDVEADTGSGSLGDRARGLADRWLGKSRTGSGVIARTGVAQRIGARIGRAHSTTTEAMGSKSGRRLVMAGAGLIGVAAAVTVAAKTGVWIGSKGGAAEAAGNMPAGGGSNRPKTGLGTELIMSDRPSSGGNSSAVLDTANQPRGSGSDAIETFRPQGSGGSGAAETASQPPEVGSGARGRVISSETISTPPTPETTRPTQPDILFQEAPGNGGGNAGEAAAQYTPPVGLKTDGNGNLQISIETQWTPEQPNVEVPSVPNADLIYDQGTLDGRVARMLVENGADANYVNSHPNEVHQISMDIYADSGFGPDKQYATGASEVLTIKPRTVEHMQQHFSGAGLDIDTPDSSAAIEGAPSGSGGGGSGSDLPSEAPPEAPDTETPGDNGNGTNAEGSDLPDSDRGSNDSGSDEGGLMDNHGVPIAAAAAGATLIGGGALATRVARRRGGDGHEDGHGDGHEDDDEDDHDGGDPDAGPTPEQLTQLEAAIQAEVARRLAAINVRLRDLEAEVTQRREAEEHEDEVWQERNGQIDLAGALSGNIDDLNVDTNPYRQTLVAEAVAAAQANTHSGVTDEATFQHEANEFFDHVFGANRPTAPGGPGLVDAAGNVVDDSLEQHRNDLYEDIAMTDAAGNTVDPPTDIDTPDQLRVPVGPDGRILPGFLDAFNDVVADARRYNRASGGTLLNDEFARMLGDTDDGLEPEISLQRFLVAAGAQFVRGEETP